jgi:hypothetical protein
MEPETARQAALSGGAARAFGRTMRRGGGGGAGPWSCDIDWRVLCTVSELSDDGAFWWDGEQWLPVAAAVKPLGYGEQLAKGDQSDQVGELQRRLAHLGYYQGDADGIFDGHTEAAVKEFQRAAGHTEDGIAQADTWQELEDSVNAHGYGSD